MFPDEPFFLLVVTPAPLSEDLKKLFLRNAWNFTACNYQREDIEAVSGIKNLIMAQGTPDQIKWLRDILTEKDLPPLFWLAEDGGYGYKDILRIYPNCADIFLPPLDMPLLAAKIQFFYKHQSLIKRNNLLSTHFNLKTRELILALDKEKKIKKELRELDKLKSDFTAVISHELKTPISAMKGAVGTLKDKELGPVNPEQMEFLDIISRNAERLKSLVSDFLDFSQLNSGQMKMHFSSQPFEPLALEAVERFKFLANQQRAKISCKIEPALPLVNVDREKVIQIFHNLLSNALKFTPEGGNINIEIKKKKNGNSGTVIYTKISDNGIGVPTKKLKDIFEKFSQVDVSSSRKYGGTGLGLPICKAIVKAHGGKIWAQNNPKGEGLSVQFQIPLEDR